MHSSKNRSQRAAAGSGFCACKSRARPRASLMCLGSAAAFLSPHLQRTDHVAGGIDRFKVHVEAPKACNVLQYLAGLLVQRAALELGMAQGQCAVILRID